MNVKNLINSQRLYFKTGRTLPVRDRITTLKKLYKALVKNKQLILDALYLDLGKSGTEGYMSELGLVLGEISYAIKNLREWVKPVKKKVSISQFPAKAFELSEPYGVVLIVSPWNYPFMLTINPLIGAIAGGNCAVLKPSENSKHTTDVIGEIISQVFPTSYVSVVKGGREANTELFDQKFDYIFFTGGQTVGRIVMEKAAKHLTPVTLELGGKSPCIVARPTNVNLAAKRIAFGKILNSGQTCVAPDYVLVEKVLAERFVKRLEYWVKRMLGENPLTNPNYPKMINRENFDRIIQLMENQNIVMGGRSDKETLKIEPTVIAGIKGNEPVMQEEIFGPILPIIEFTDIAEAKEFILERDKPLALYLFTNSKRTRRYILNGVSFGGGCINDTVIHMASPHMGFGGVGASGMGSYHGKHSFDTFSHKKSILKQSNLLDVPLRYHPYGKASEKIIEKLLR